MIRMGKRLGRMAAAGATLCLAVVLAGCSGGVRGGANETESVPEAVGAGEASVEFDQFKNLMESQEKTYAFDYLETYTIGEGDDAEEGVTSFAAKVDDTGTVERMYRVYGADDSDLPGVECYYEGNTLIQVNDGMASDMSAEFEDDESEPLEVLDGTWLGFTFAPAALAEVTAEGDDTLYRFVFENALGGGLGVAENVSQAEITYRFDAMGALLEERIDLTGTVTMDGESAPVTSSIVEQYSDWGNVEVPEAPEAEAKLVVRDTAEASAELEERLRSLPPNMSVETETSVTQEIDGQQETSEVYAEALIDRTNGFKCATYLEIDGNEDEALLTLYDGERSMVFQGDEVVGEAQTPEPDDPEGIERALSVLACAETIDVYEHSDGGVEYIVTADVKRVSDQALFEGVERVTTLVTDYYFGPEGDIQSVLMDVKGVPTGASEGSSIAMEANAYYYDLGATEVPAVPF